MIFKQFKMGLVTVRSFDNNFKANIALTRLESMGIECFFKDDFTVNIDPILSNAIGGIKIQVREEDAQEALKFLQQFDEEYLQSVKCPQCGKATFTLINKPGATNFITAILTWIFSSYAVATEQVYHCASCGFESKELPEYAFGDN
jgi:predicted RNA-binding Zn-ribbon protein involved in translation (DUF1610 family)